MNILVTGGAGYIGSITAEELKKEGHQVYIYDSMENGHAWAVKNKPLIKGRTQNRQLVTETLKTYEIEAVIHFAAYIEMGESMKNPYKYFEDNTYGTLQLLKAMVDQGVDKLVFSSTAGVYGEPENIPIKEEDAKNPTNPYGESKLMVEKMLQWFSEIHGLRSIILRYFNAAGAALDNSLGEAHQSESHLIPNLIKAVLQGREFTLFGDDYDTKDGTCVRDYVHVVDLAQAHLLALNALKEGKESTQYNVGIGKGYSNKEVIEAVQKTAEKDFSFQIGERRPGDAAKLIADSTKIQKELGWQPQYSDLKTIVETAYRWHKNGDKPA
jgi:UDP-glucose 4-epimerase